MPSPMLVNPRPGPTNSVLDVPGIRVGQVTMAKEKSLTGATVILMPPDGATASVDARGGAPGSRETVMLRPENRIQRINALVLTGGSAFGLGVADGVMRELLADGIGHRVGDGSTGIIVPIVPAAVLFDLGRAGLPITYPKARDGRRAVRAASSEFVAEGCVGAGTGAVSGIVKGGIGSASVELGDGIVVAAVVALNAYGQVFDRRTGELLAERTCLDGDLPEGGAGILPARLRDVAARFPLVPRLGENTTLAAVITNADVSKAGCTRLAIAGQDGIARGVSPAHTQFDGDVVFAAATRTHPVTELGVAHLEQAAADVVTRAIARAVVAATTAVGTVLGRTVHYYSWQELVAGDATPDDVRWWERLVP